MAGRAPFLPKKISRYIAEHAVREPEILRELRAATASLPNAGMQIGADQGQFMALLVRLLAGEAGARVADLNTPWTKENVAFYLASCQSGKNRAPQPAQAREAVRQPG